MFLQKCLLPAHHISSIRGVSLFFFFATCNFHPLHQNRAIGDRKTTSFFFTHSIRGAGELITFPLPPVNIKRDLYIKISKPGLRPLFISLPTLLFLCPIFLSIFPVSHLFTLLNLLVDFFRVFLKVFSVLLLSLLSLSHKGCHHQMAS